ncbi:MAG: beta-propeller domain-containing protein [Eubacteriales bacterium]|nr:beta-propeller domain-containing protein [Eubacteriales bacterium]
MFREKYSKDMENIKPSEDALSRTRIKMSGAKAGNVRVFGKKQLIALAACFCLIAGSFAVVFMANEPFNNKEYEDYENPYIVIPDTNVPGSSAIPLKSGANYKSIFKKIENASMQNKNEYMAVDFLTDGATAEEDIQYAEAPQNKSTTTGADDKYSDTNNQVSGVQEADIIKTDGKYIYACGKTSQYSHYGYYYSEAEITDEEEQKGRVYILSADDGNMEFVSTVKIRDDEKDTQYVLNEILLFEDIMILIKSGQHAEPMTTEESREVKYYSYNRYTYTTSVEIYDISDRANPVFQNELYQSGYYNSSRMIGEDLYIITTHTVYNPDENKPETYIPYCSSYSSDYLVPADCIYVADEVTNAVYTVVTGIDVTNPYNHISNASVLGFAGTVYSSTSNIYVTAFRSNNIYGSIINEKDIVGQKTVNGETDIYRFSIDDGVVVYSASNSVEGSLLNQFSMDEYEGDFRIATTVYEYKPEIQSYNNNNNYVYYRQTSYYNNLYILDEELSIAGKIEGIAPNERIYSVRFDGDIGYMVTFRQTDPLFAVDLSDKTNPKILSALKIPGFSSYMHPYGEGLLFGFGKDANENGQVRGLKLSMFDISDKTDVKEKSVLNLGQEYYHSEAIDNHKAILVDSEKNLIGFPVFKSGSCGYEFYTYKNNSFVKVGGIDLSNYYISELRGLYIGNYIYIFAENMFIKSYNIDNFELIETLSFTYKK